MFCDAFYPLRDMDAVKPRTCVTFGGFAFVNLLFPPFQCCVVLSW